MGLCSAVEAALTEAGILDEDVWSLMCQNLVDMCTQAQPRVHEGQHVIVWLCDGHMAHSHQTRRVAVCTVDRDHPDEWACAVVIPGEPAGL